MKNRLHLVISLFALTVCLLAQGWLFLRAFAAVSETISFQSYPLPYRATVVEIERRSTGRSGTYTPIIEVVTPDRGTFRFKSSRQSALNPFSVGESIAVVSRPFDRHSASFEIDHALHLWIEDVLLACLFPTAIIVSILWSWHRLPAVALTFSPFRSLRRTRP